MDDFSLLIDLHRTNSRQGPGGDAETELALRLCRLDPQAPVKVADIGCGTGASTLGLARLMPNARIVAADFLKDFLDLLEDNASKAGVAERIETLACAMEELPFEEEQFDLIWSEGAIYNMGFEAGLKAWRRFLKPGGVLAVSEITWLTGTRPDEIEAHWTREYPEIDMASAKMRVLERQGYSPIGYLTLPEHCWLDNYYRPIQDRLPEFLSRHNHSSDAEAIANAEQQEIALYEKHKAHYSYGFYIAQRV
ncbi:MAG: class I SAM-dependent methyltransferase [Wenzhouxiangella sp.]|jgi:ubiquinone/menaquinone biosynthesis C-methylase UbiE|nr:class I SAM-dependent methyltransferase [Wenzhouxiangella sp.]